MDDRSRRTRLLALAIAIASRGKLHRSGANADFAVNRRAWVRLTTSGMVPLSRPDTHLDNYGTVQRPAKVLGRLEAGFVVNF